ncbi:unnamed protein product [Absidia cylindrospora]
MTSLYFFIYQCGLLFIGVLVSAIFIVYLYELYFSTRLSQAILPFPFLSTPVVSQLEYPQFGIFLSIGSVAASMVNLMLTCRVTVYDVIRMTPSHRGLGPPLFSTAAILAVFMGVIEPMLCIVNNNVTWVEVGFWSLPVMMFAMDQLAIHMMRQVEANFTELEKSKYKYKGA